MKSSRGLRRINVALLVVTVLGLAFAAGTEAGRRLTPAVPVHLYCTPAELPG